MINATGVIDMDIGTRQDNKVGPIIAEAQEDIHQFDMAAVVQEVIQDTQEIVIPEKVLTIDTEEEDIQEVGQIGAGKTIGQRKGQEIDRMKSQEMAREKIQEGEATETKTGQGKKNDHEKKTGHESRIELGIRTIQERGRGREIDQGTISQGQEKDHMKQVEESIAEAHKGVTAEKDTAEMIT